MASLVVSHDILTPQFLAAKMVTSPYLIVSIWPRAVKIFRFRLGSGVDAFDTSWQALLGKGEGSNYRVARQGGEDGMAFVGGTGDITGGGPVADGEWHHFVGTTANGGVSKMYIDGVLAGTNAGPVAIVNERSSDPAALWIGNNAGAPAREWEGGIDELAIWNRVLTAGEISFLAGGAQVPEPASVGMLLFGLLGLLGLRRRVR